MRIISEWESGHVPDAVTHSLFNEVRVYCDIEKTTELKYRNSAEYLPLVLYLED